MSLKLKKLLTARNLIAVLVTGGLIAGLITVQETGGLEPKKLDTSVDSSDVVISAEVAALNEIVISASQRYCYENWPTEIQYYKLVMSNGFCDLGFQPIPYKRDCLIVAHSSMEWVRDLTSEKLSLYGMNNFPIVFTVDGPCSKVPKNLVVPKNVQTTNLTVYGGLSSTSFVFSEGILGDVEEAVLRGPDVTDENLIVGKFHGDSSFASWESFYDYDNLWTANDKTFQLYGLIYTSECSWDVTCDAEYPGE